MMVPITAQDAREYEVQVPAGAVVLDGTLTIPPGAAGVVLFAHGSGSSRFSPRNRVVAAALQRGGLATLLLDLLTQEEERIDQLTGHLRFDIRLLAQRLLAGNGWLRSDELTSDFSIGYYGASTGAGAALIAAAERPDSIKAVVSRGGRPDLAAEALARVSTPTLLIVGGDDLAVLELNREALRSLSGVKRLETIPGATHLFEEPGALEEVARLAREWFDRYLPGSGGQ